MIVGEVRRGNVPYVRGRVLLPRLHLAAVVHFLVDTGAGGTMIHPQDVRQLGVDFERLCRERPGQVRSNRGVGGSVRVLEEEALLLFRDATTLDWHEYRQPVSLAEGTDYNGRYPSLLGRDVLGHWAMEYRPARGMLQFTVE